MIAKYFFLFVFALLSIPSLVLAAPSLYNVVPQNGSYMFGRDTDVFSINILTQNLNLTTVKLHARVQDPTSTWSAFSMNCFNSTLQDWMCNTTITGLGSLVNDGNTVLFYFDANNTNNEYGSNGTESSPNRVGVDRSGPKITFITPTNKSYVHGSLKINLQATDVFSGVNSSSVKYSFDNSSWLTTSLSSSLYVADKNWDTTPYTNNASVKIYATAADNLGNVNYTNINVTVDNEVPQIFINFPQSSSILNGTVYFEFNAGDSYSGLDNSAASYIISNQIGQLNCVGTTRNLNCSSNFNTNIVSDGTYTLNYTISDFAGNVGSNTTSVIVDNLLPSVNFVSPSNGAKVSGTITIKISATDSGSGIDNVTFRWEGSNITNSSWNILSCSGSPQSRACTADYDTTIFGDGNYKLDASAIDKTGKQGFSTIDVSVTNGGTISGGTTTTTRSSSIITTTSTGTGQSAGKTKNETQGGGILGGIFGPSGPLGPGASDFFSKNTTSIGIGVTIVVLIAALAYLFWPRRPQKVYPGYKPQS